MLKEDILNWASNVDSVEKEVLAFVKDRTLPHLPSYEEITSRKVLYSAYSNVIEISNEHAVLTSKVINMSMMRLQFKRQLRTEGYGQSIVTQFNNIIDEIYERVNVLDKHLTTYKVALDNQIRFYQSVQYILASPRLNSMD